ncbi:MAG: ABC transporter ATP-binding protein [Lachnospiraceae bacterium]|nr:ABC transporter ATP-binding protein [Lachnospiraceae bacterium]
MIEVKDLVKKYGEHVAVDHLNFTVEKGQILGFLGPNGAGKSTTMNMLTGYISMTGGSVTINGFDIYEEPEEAKKAIGYLPELPPVYPDMTVREYLKFVMDIKKVPRGQRAAMLADIMARTQVTDVADRLIRHLSKGYRQRVGLAQAIVGYPEVIILDEPTVGLDPMQIIEIRDLIKELAKKHTVIISSHILSEISEVCDTVMIINKGKLVVMDSVENLPKHLERSISLKLVVRGEEGQIRTALGSVDRIEKLTFEPAEEDGLLAVSIGTRERADVREEVFYALAAAKCPIYGMTVDNLSLEDIFLEMTKGDEGAQEQVQNFTIDGEEE